LGLGPVVEGQVAEAWRWWHPLPCRGNGSRRWVGSEFLVVRRVLPDGSRSVMHGTVEGLVEPTKST
jgi:hypothetical protein